MKRTFLLIGTLTIIVVVTIIVYGSLERANSENALTCQRLMRGYVFCDATDNHPCNGAYVAFSDIWEHGNQYEEFTNEQGYFNLGYIVCDDYLVAVNCGGDCENCYYIDVDQDGCHKDGSCASFHFDGTCILHIHTSPETCPPDTNESR